MSDLEQWWRETAEADLAAVAPKASEYGSADLDVMGEAMIVTHDWRTEPQFRRRIGQELAIGFYLLGKVGRLVGAYAQGKLPSDDTIHDITVYSMMLRRVRAEGGWPE